MKTTYDKIRNSIGKNKHYMKDSGAQLDCYKKTK